MARIIASSFGTRNEPEDGRVLYATHHFGREELLQGQGFCNIRVEERIEASSRRPDQRARFYYVACERASAPA